MKIKDMVNHFPVNTKDIDVNPLRIAEDYYFHQPYTNDYRDEAIKAVVKKKLSFDSTCNSVFEIAKKFIHVSCPGCNKTKLEAKGGTGSGDIFHIDYQCPLCETKVSITIPVDGISINFPEKK